MDRHLKVGGRPAPVISISRVPASRTRPSSAASRTCLRGRHRRHGVASLRRTHAVPPHDRPRPRRPPRSSTPPCERSRRLRLSMARLDLEAVVVPTDRRLFGAIVVVGAGKASAATRGCARSTSHRPRGRGRHAETAIPDRCRPRCHSPGASRSSAVDIPFPTTASARPRPDAPSRTARSAGADDLVLAPRSRAAAPRCGRSRRTASASRTCRRRRGYCWRRARPSRT